MKTQFKFYLIPIIISVVVFSCSTEEIDEPQAPAPNDNVSDGSGDGGQNTPTVFERLQGSTFRQIESPDDCATCEEEINYYIFSSDALQITGTKTDNTCEQNDIQPIGTCAECATIEEDSVDKLTLCLDSLCQTITFVSENEIEFDFPAANQKLYHQEYLVIDQFPAKLHYVRLRFLFYQKLNSSKYPPKYQLLMVYFLLTT